MCVIKLNEICHPEHLNEVREVMKMNLYISDTHFGHANVIKFDQRPFRDVDEMDWTMLETWNSRVRPEDDVWFLGDFCHKSNRSPVWYLSRLTGKKHLVLGNHDQVLLDNPEALSYFESVDQIKIIKDRFKNEKVEVTLCHYPILEWHHKMHGTWHVHGHIHTDTGETFEILSQFEKALNAGAPINNYMPVSLEELIRNNQIFREKVKHHAFENRRYEK